VTGIILRGLFAALGLWVATFFVAGLRFDKPGTLIIAGLLLGIVNAIVRPVLVILTLPITVLTLGLFLLVINAALVALVAALLPGMQLSSFGAALVTTLIVSVVSWIASGLLV
jgi:putative membrane protein